MVLPLTALLVSCGGNIDGPFSPLATELPAGCGIPAPKCESDRVSVKVESKKFPEGKAYVAELNRCQRGDLDSVWRNSHLDALFAWADSSITRGPLVNSMDRDHSKFEVDYKAGPPPPIQVSWRMEFDIKRYAQDSDGKPAIVGWFKKTSKENAIKFWDGCFEVKENSDGFLSLAVRNRLSHGLGISPEKSRGAAQHIAEILTR